VRNVRAMDEVVRAAMDDARFYTRLLTGFAVLALVLGLIGVYGVMTYAASRRTREFGVRLALGATRRALLLHVMARAMTPVAIGVVVGVGGALALARLLSSFLFDVAPGDPTVLAAVAVLLALAAAGAALVPAVRAARLSPVSALQAE
jgi:ABC-type antimicrobial peptide transport system permease subunit